MEQYHDLSKKVAVNHKAKEERKLLPDKMDSITSPSTFTDIFDNEKKKPKTYSTSTSSDECDIRRYESRCRDRKSILQETPSPLILITTIK